MAKSSGIGGLLLFNGYDLSGDVSAVNTVSNSQALFDMTAIDKSAMERLAGLGDGEISVTAFFNDAAGAAHPILSARGSTDKQVTYAVSSTLGAAAWSTLGKQVDYNGVRGADGSLAFTVQTMAANGEGVTGGDMLTAGKRTDTGATQGSSVDGLAATTAGAVLYLHVTAFSGTDVTIKVEDSANNSAWSDLSGASFTAVTSGPQVQRIALSSTATVRRYLRATTTTSGGFTSVTFALHACRR